MPRASYAHANFTAGELSPLLDGRVDLSKYANGCKTLENMYVVPEGPAIYRPGTYYAGSTKTHSSLSILVPFVFSTEQAYIIEFGNLYIRFWKDYGQITKTGAAYEITSPYSQTDLAELKWTQSADTMFLFHPDHAIRTLTRTSHTNWTLTEAEFLDGPWMSENTNTAHRLKVSGKAGNYLLTSTRDMFDATHVGAYFRLCGSGWSNRVDFGAGGQYGDVSIMHGEFYTSLTPQVTLGWNGKVTLQQALVPGQYHNYASMTSAQTRDFYEPQKNVRYRLVVHDDDYTAGQCSCDLYQDERWGVVRIRSVINAKTAYVSVILPLPMDWATTPFTRWQEGAWSAYRGYPRCGVFFEDRFWAAGSKHQPQTIWGSRSGDYYNMTPGARDDSAINVTLSSSQVNAILWMASKQRLMVGTNDSEWTVGASNPEEPVTPGNVRAVCHTTHGTNGISASGVSGVLFFEPNGRKLREMSYALSSDSYVAQDLTMLARHVTQTGIVSSAYQSKPYSILWCVRNDGVLSAMTYLTSEEVVAWHRHVTDGDVESVAVIPGSNDQDDVWMIVKRTIGGATKRYVEYMKHFEYGAKINAFYVDSGVTYSGSPATTISGLSHLEGETVSILADGAVQASKVVASGSITLDRPGSTVHVGLPYTGTLKTMRLEGGSADGISQGKMKRIHEAVLRFCNSLGGTFGIEGKMNVIPYRTPSDDMDASPGLYTGDQRVEFPMGYDRDACVVVQQTQPLPLQVIGMFLRFNTYD